MAFDPQEDRDSHGRWTRGGNSGDELPVAVDQRVLDVSGDEWNKRTAARLEEEYAAVRPELDKIAQKAQDEDVEVTGPASDWEDLSGSIQSQAEEKYIESSYDSNYESEVDNWHSSDGGALYDAEHALAEDSEFKEDWLADFISERKDNDEERIPYTAQQLSDAIGIKAADDGGDNPEITFNNDFLSEPDNANPNENPNQLTLPGVDVKPLEGHTHLTEEMRNSIITSLMNAFRDKAKDKAADLEPPEYLAESAKEQSENSWGEMSDDDKYNYVKNDTNLLSDNDEDSTTTGPVEIPNKFDPLNNTSGEDYRRTQGLAKYMADERAAQLIMMRAGAGTVKLEDNKLGLSPMDEQRRMQREMQKVDFDLWSGWKSSSTGSAGKLLQVAAAEELGGRLREEKPAKELPEDFPEQVKKAKEILAGQHYDLDEVNWANKTLIDYDEATRDLKANRETQVVKSENVDGYIRLPELNVVRNGAASTTVSRDVANGWGGTTNQAPSGINKKEVIDFANREFSQIGGYEGVKAAIRAKWETTQYLLDRADLPMVQVFRGINMAHRPDVSASGTGVFNPPVSGIVQLAVTGTPKNLKDFDIGAKLTIQSGKTLTKVSAEDTPGNKGSGIGTWSYDEAPTVANRVVLRAEVPRTAIVSVPAYGVNVKSEQEVVVVGTAWKNWDAWSGRAPSFDQVPMHATQAGLDKEFDTVWKRNVKS